MDPQGKQAFLEALQSDKQFAIQVATVLAKLFEVKGSAAYNDVHAKVLVKDAPPTAPRGVTYLSPLSDPKS